MNGDFYESESSPASEFDDIGKEGVSPKTKGKTTASRHASRRHRVPQEDEVEKEEKASRRPSRHGSDWKTFEDSYDAGDLAKLARDFGINVEAVRKTLRSHCEYKRENDVPYPGDEEAHRMYRMKLQRRQEWTQASEDGQWRRRAYVSESDAVADDAAE